MNICDKLLIYLFPNFGESFNFPSHLASQHGWAWPQAIGFQSIPDFIFSDFIEMSKSHWKEVIWFVEYSWWLNMKIAEKNISTNKTSDVFIRKAALNFCSCCCRPNNARTCNWIKFFHRPDSGRSCRNHKILPHKTEFKV